jgi:hypothetical protein
VECDPQSLAGLLSLASASVAQSSPDIRVAWSVTDLAAIWRHQLAAPLLLDLGSINDDANTAVSTHTRSAPRLESFADLLGHPSPPIELLQLVKQFAKSQRHAGTALFPAEIASLLYYLAIVLAALRLRRRITRMDHSHLRQGVEWCLRQPWIDPATRELFEVELTTLFGDAP